ncbi:MAG: hypothetical protein NTX17_04660 [Candidatus Eisenbacteria bacterium]|nr:hypothetical protein [Candidatus Eisenbacteria bacterium]
MKGAVVVLLLVLLLVPCVANAVDAVGCDVWLESGNVVMWAACHVGEWLRFNEATDDLLWEVGYVGP